MAPLFLPWRQAFGHAMGFSIIMALIATAAAECTEDEVKKIRSCIEKNAELLQTASPATKCSLQQTSNNCYPACACEEGSAMRGTKGGLEAGMTVFDDCHTLTACGQLVNSGAWWGVSVSVRSLSLERESPKDLCAPMLCEP